MERNKLTNRTESRASQKPHHIPAEQTRCQQQPSSARQFTVWCCSIGCLLSVAALLCSQWDLYRWVASTQSSLEQKTRSPGAELKMIPFWVCKVRDRYPGNGQWRSGEGGLTSRGFSPVLKNLAKLCISCRGITEGPHTAMSEWPLPSEKGEVKHRELVAIQSHSLWIVPRAVNSSQGYISWAQASTDVMAASE